MNTSQRKCTQIVPKRRWNVTVKSTQEKQGKIVSIILDQPAKRFIRKIYNDVQLNKIK